MGITGCILVGKGIKWGWLFYAFASSINVCLGLHSGYIGMAVGSSVYALVELKGYYHAHYKVKKDEREIIHE